MKSTTPIRDLTAAARMGLSGAWGKSIGVLCVYVLLLTGVSLVPIAGWLLQFVFSAPLAVGLAVYFLATVRGQKNPFNLLFDGFNRFGTSVCTYLLVLLICTLWMIPFVALAVLQPVFLKDGSMLAVVAFGSIWVLSMLSLMIFLQMRYGLALYVVADDPSVRARQAVRRSAVLMKGNYWRLGLLWLRFIGWQLLCILTLGLGLIWLAPYFVAATTAFYDDLAVSTKRQG